MKFLSFVPTFICLLSLFTSSFVYAESKPGYRIEVTLNPVPNDTIQLGYYFGKTQYLKDTAVLDQGKFVFEGNESLAPGIYLIVIPPDNKFIHLVVSEKEQHFTAYFEPENIVGSSKFKGSDENGIYYDYLRQLDKKRPRADEIHKIMKEDSSQIEKLKPELESINADVKKLQDQIIEKNPQTMTALILKGNQELPLPDFKEFPESERSSEAYKWFRKHYLDNFDLSDGRSMRSGLMQTKVDYFLQKLTYPYPDSQIISMDYLLGKMKPNDEIFQYYLVQFLNDAAKSKLVGYDAIYVHLIDEYYAKGLAPWVDQEQLDKMKVQAEKSRNILLGRTAPDIVFTSMDNRPFNVHGIKSNYTVLFFWDPECGHCKKSMPAMVEFYKNYKDKGVQVLGICTKTGTDITDCWNTVKERGMDQWINAADQTLRTRYKTIYDIQTTPQIFILDKDKKIVMKKIGVEDLPRVMDEIMRKNP